MEILIAMVGLVFAFIYDFSKQSKKSAQTSKTDRETRTMPSETSSGQSISGGGGGDFKKTMVGCSVIIIIALSVCLLVFCIIPEIKVQVALGKMRKGDYAAAADVLLHTPEGNDRYLDLWVYAHYRAEYEANPYPSVAADIYNSIHRLEDEILLPCHEEICQFAEEIRPMAERQKELDRIAAEQKEERLRSRAENGIPYVGMPERYIDDTLMGKADSTAYKTSTSCVYKWTASDGCPLLEVKARNGVVEEVERRNESEHWQGNTCLPNAIHKKPGAQRPYRTPIPDNYDPYDAAYYVTPEDFYDDYYDDFWSFEEAELYWYQHN